MNAAIQGAVIGVVVALAMFAFDYLMIRRNAAERAKKQHKTEPVFDDADRSRIRSLARFVVVLPPAFALLFWMIWG